MKIIQVNIPRFLVNDFGEVQSDTHHEQDCIYQNYNPQYEQLEIQTYIQDRLEDIFDILEGWSQEHKRIYVYNIQRIEPNPSLGSLEPRWRLKACTFLPDAAFLGLHEPNACFTMNSNQQN